MASTQIIASTSIFSNPFCDSYNDPEAFGSYTTCQGPPPKPRTSPVVKLRKHIASALTPTIPQHNTNSFRYELFEPDIVSLDFVPEARPITARTGSPPPAARKISRGSLRSNNYMFPERTSSLKMDPFDHDIVTLPFVPEDTYTTTRANLTSSAASSISKSSGASENPIRKLRHLPSRATIANARSSSVATDLLEDNMSNHIPTTKRSRQATATGGGLLHPDGAGQLSAKGCRCQCDCEKCRSGSTNLCQCACYCESCRCKSRKLPNRLLRMFGGKADGGSRNK